MKIFGTILLALVPAAFVLTFAGCMTETTRTITTDKTGTVTETTVTRKGSDPAALKLVSVAAEIYLPRRPVVIREEKAACFKDNATVEGAALVLNESLFAWENDRRR